jgi:hypothetical protein
MTRRAAPPPSPKKVVPEGKGVGDLDASYGRRPVKFTGADDALYERLVFDHVVDPEDARPRERFEAVAFAIRDVLSGAIRRGDLGRDCLSHRRVRSRLAAVAPNIVTNDAFT